MQPHIPCPKNKDFLTLETDSPACLFIFYAYTLERRQSTHILSLCLKHKQTAKDNQTCEENQQHKREEPRLTERQYRRQRKLLKI